MLDQNQQLALLASVNEINLKLKCITLAVENPHLGTDNIKKAGEYYAFITTHTGLNSEMTGAPIGEAVAPAVNNANVAPGAQPFTEEEIAANAAAETTAPIVGDQVPATHEDLIIAATTDVQN